jgi:hypothetical protein
MGTGEASPYRVPAGALGQGCTFRQVVRLPTVEGIVMSQAMFAFPQPLSEKYRPQKIADFVGLEKAKKIISKLAVNPYQSAWLFLAASGTGKTTLAMAFAAELPAELHHIPATERTLETVQAVCSRCYYSPRSEDWKPVKFHVVLIDEADRMSDAAQLALLSKLDSTAFPPNTIFIFTANATENLEKRFLSRCRTIEFSSYGTLAGDDPHPRLIQLWRVDATKVTQNPKTDTEEIRGKLGQKSGRGDEDDAQEGAHGRADRGGTAAGGSGSASGRTYAARWGSARPLTISGNGNIPG